MGVASRAAATQDQGRPRLPRPNATVADEMLALLTLSDEQAAANEGYGAIEVSSMAERPGQIASLEC
jgi:hypothetical protein